MPSRLERNYSSSKINKRTVKNKELYNSINNTDYKVISSTNDFFHKPENEFKEKVEAPSILKTEKLSSLIMEEEKERDINKILKQAKSTRNDEDELEKKRRLDKKEYNITKKINVNDEEAVSKFRNQNRKVVENEEELSDLIDTIYSKSKSDNLLDSLMPSSLDETIVSDDKISDFVNQEKNDKELIDNSFFTSSVGLTKDDLIDEVQDDVNPSEEEFFDDIDKTSPLKVILIVVGVIIFLVALGLIIYKYFLVK